LPGTLFQITMKKLLLVAVLIIAADIMFGATPPEPVLKAFSQKFPNAKEVKWGKENDSEWEAGFKFDNIITSTNFSINGEWIETEKEIPVSTLPEAIVSAINKSHKNCKIIGAAIIERAKSETVYEAEIKTRLTRKEVFYKTDGTVVR
jgi:hypothetical protein